MENQDTSKISDDRFQDYVSFENKLKQAKKQAKLQERNRVKEIIETWKNELFGIVKYHKDTGSGEIIMRAELIKKVEELLQKIEERKQ